MMVMRLGFWLKWGGGLGDVTLGGWGGEACIVGLSGVAGAMGGSSTVLLLMKITAGDMGRGEGLGR